MSQIYLLMAIVAEVAGTTCMKFSEGMTRTVPSVAMFGLYGVSLGLLALALKGIDVSVAYAIWSGVGTALITVVGLIYFKEPVTVARIVCIALIVIGAVGLNLTGAAH
jgi:small multidrug resistance pump